MSIAKTMLFGLLLAVVAAVLLFVNEGRAVKTARSLAEGAGLVVEVDSTAINPANEGRLVHISGGLKTLDTPKDSRFGVGAPGAVRLSRKVEMFQWLEVERAEKRKTASGGEETVTTISYEKLWSAESIDSARFKSADAPKNPAMAAQGETFGVGEAARGAFLLSGGAVSGLGKTRPLSLQSGDWQAFKTALGGAKPVWLRDNGLHVGQIFGKPAIGDLRVTYEMAVADTISAAGAQTGARLGPYKTSNGRSLFLIQDGIAPAAEMFDSAIAGNTMLTWFLRVAGLIASFIGFKLALNPLTRLGDAVPVVGGLITAGTSLVAFAGMAVLGGLAIGMGWIFYRPALGLAIVGVAVVAALAAVFMARGKARPAAA